MPAWDNPSTYQNIGEIILLAGGVIMAIGYGIRRIYRIARTVEDIFHHVVEEKVERQRLQKELKDHIQMEESRDRVRDDQFITIVNDLNEITREIRPNGGSSMKDSINQMQRDIAVLTEWKLTTQARSARQM